MTPTEPAPDAAAAEALRRLLGPRLPSPLQPVADRRFDAYGVHLLLKRDDLIHPELPGNKWRKLAPNLRDVSGGPDASDTRATGVEVLVTFGGAYSNHLRATAAAGRLLGMATVGVVRGDELAARPLNPSLARCAADGMRLRFVDRTSYRRKAEPDTLARLVDMALAGTGYSPAAARVIPEGGSNAAAVRGCAGLGAELRGAGDAGDAVDGVDVDVVDVVAVACGTGGTLAGLAAGLGPRQRALGIPVLRGGFLGDEVRRLQRAAFGRPRGRWSVDERFQGTGFARPDPEVTAFADAFGDAHGLRLERTYVARLLYALSVMTAAGEFMPGTSLAAVITGAPDPERAS